MKQQDETVRLVATGLERLEMPKRELMSFDGDPKGYPRFIKGFEVNVERRVKDYDERLTFLIQYCRGAAKEAIENCIMLPPEQGYREAKDILRKNFGQKHIVVRAFIDKAKWAEESSRLIESGIEPEFSHLTKFVERRAVVANTVFGKLVGTKPDGEKDPRPVRRKMAHDQAVRATTLATQASYGYQRQEIASEPRQTQRAGTQVSNSPEFLCPSVCLFCDGSHALEKCFRFRDRSYKECKEFVLNKRLCMNCLRENHVAKRCRLARACMLSGCAR
ncbi:uncharacterized protein [Montipora capricornis]|uniref:uncharacterized protein n=1 Tax=Montipora capricornis TaxID=246305 RepID=UPI0035F16756